MTTATEIYDGLVSRISALLPNHKRLPYPYDLENNNEDFLEQGWGIAVRSSENTNRELCNRKSLRRSYEIILTRKYYSLDHDVTKRADTEKSLLEDAWILYDDFCENLWIASEKGLIQALGDNGIEPVFAAEKPFFTVRINADVELFR